MKLIDADALHTVLVKMNDFGELSAKKAIRMVSKAPTVEAIPVSWIKERMSNIEDTMLEMAWSMLISDWAERETE